MASVSSLDQDMRKLRLDRYTPQAANEVRAWVEEVLGEKLAGGDLMEALKDGVALCKMVNLATLPGVRYKQSAMPFVQMENISNFLRACEMPPFNMPSHDRFLTVDLYDSKDPAQVLQCIGAFSRQAHAIKPSVFRRAIGGRSKGSAISPQVSGSSQGNYARPPAVSPSHGRGGSTSSDTAVTSFSPSNNGTYSGRTSPMKSSNLARGGLASGGPVSSWSSKDDEGKTAPAWNIHQYGYMGGASQGNQGVSFGARRQITSASPNVPNLTEKERRRKQEAEQQRLREEEDEQRRRAEMDAAEEREKAEEERRWEEETRRQREKERREAEEEKRRWDQEQRRWKEEEDSRQREERDTETRLAAERNRTRSTSDARLNGQFLSQYQASQPRQPRPPMDEPSRSTSEQKRIEDLEKQLELAKERERQYEAERQSRTREENVRKTNMMDFRNAPFEQAAPSLPTRPSAGQTSHEDDWAAAERDHLRKEWQQQQQQDEPIQPPKPPRSSAADPTAGTPPLPKLARPLPNPESYTPTSTSTPNRTSLFLTRNQPPQPPQATTHRPSDYSSTTEHDLENQRRQASQAKTKAGGWVSKSLLEREMERERERQREWEEAQKQSQSVARDESKGAGPGQSWDVNQYGYTGGDSQNRGGPGLGVGGARRQVIGGPRPLP